MGGTDMQDIHKFAAERRADTAHLPIRLCAGVHLLSGEPVGAFVETSLAFDDRPSFDVQADKPSCPSAVDWVLARLDEVITVGACPSVKERPIVLPVPSAGFGDPDLAPRCADAMAVSHLCPQEICFEFSDSAFAASDKDSEPLLRAFRQRGFRVGIDARQSWCAGLSGPCWLMVDSLRVTAKAALTNARLRDRIDFAFSAGVAVVAERPRWRDGEILADLGVHYGLRPLADA
ncbi:MAG: hypothetical protein AAGJ29_07175 [Pseudomonadota bacterium]